MRNETMDWFEQLTGFREAGYATTQSRLAVEGDRLHSLVNGKSYGIGTLELASIGELRTRVAASNRQGERTQVQVVQGNIRTMHQLPEYANALVQVASQFNFLEMISPEVTPEHGVTRYGSDHTQGPACAIAAGAGTIFRNYFADVGGQIGQTTDRQLDGLVDLGQSLASTLGMPVSALWKMRNGYALCTRAGLLSIARHLDSLNIAQRDELTGRLRIGLHRDVQVTDGLGENGHLVSQVYCSALPVAYSAVEPSVWAPFARLVLEAAYEGTVLSAIFAAAQGRSNILLLTRLGGGAFGNESGWIDAAMRRALLLAVDAGLDIRLVSHGRPSAEIQAAVAQFNRELP